MIQRKKKPCWLCGGTEFLWSKGLCKPCWGKMYAKGVNRSARKKIAWQSDSFKERMKKYKDLRKVYLAEHPVCEVCKVRKAKEIHHKRGRNGENLYKDFLAVDRECHRRIEENPEWARENGFMLSRL